MTRQPPLTADDVAAAVRTALADTTVTVDLAGVVSALSAAVSLALEEAAKGPTADEIADALLGKLLALQELHELQELQELQEAQARLEVEPGHLNGSTDGPTPVRRRLDQAASAVSALTTRINEARTHR